MHFCTARIAIGGDNNNVFPATFFDPISWPEVMVLQQVHGNTSIEDVQPFVNVEQSPRDERHRLSEKYREEVVAMVFGGQQPPREMEAPGARMQTGVTWMNPLTHQLEITGEKSPERELDLEITTPAPTSPTSLKFPMTSLRRPGGQIVGRALRAEEVSHGAHPDAAGDGLQPARRGRTQPRCGAGREQRGDAEIPAQADPGGAVGGLHLAGADAARRPVR